MGLSCCQRQTVASSAWKRMVYRGFYSQSLGFITVLSALYAEINYHKYRHFFCIIDLLFCMIRVLESFFFHAVGF